MTLYDDKFLNGLPGQVVLTFARHGACDWTASRSNPPLTAAGEQQAAQLRFELASQSFEQVFVSPALRALSTAHLALSGAIHGPPQIEAWLDELRYPDWGDTDAAMIEEALNRARRLPDKDRWGPFAGEGGEAMTDFVDRVQRGLRRVLDAHGIRSSGDSRSVWISEDEGPQHFLFVAHQAVISVCLSVLLGAGVHSWSWEAFRVPPCSLSIVGSVPLGSEFAFAIRRLGSWDHLAASQRAWK